MYKNGRGVIQDDVEAVKWFRKAAEQGYPAAQDNLGWMYKNGRGVSSGRCGVQDDVEAVKWFRKAAEHGDVSV
jgi:TPR repeat protein